MIADGGLQYSGDIVKALVAGANAVMLGGGYFNPLTGYMNLTDALSVAEKMQTVDGLFFPVPILNMTKESGVEAGSRIALLGVDDLIDFNCKSAREEGNCFVEHCGDNLLRFRSSLLERRKHERLACRPINGLFLPEEHL